MKKSVEKWLLETGQLEMTTDYEMDGAKIVHRHLSKAGRLHAQNSGVFGTRKATSRWYNGIRHQAAQKLAKYLVASHSYRLMHAGWDGYLATRYVPSH